MAVVEAVVRVMDSMVARVVVVVAQLEPLQVVKVFTPDQPILMDLDKDTTVATDPVVMLVPGVVVLAEQAAAELQELECPVLLAEHQLDMPEVVAVRAMVLVPATAEQQQVILVVVEQQDGHLLRMLEVLADLEL
jgi:hypothetical protein